MLSVFVEYKSRYNKAHGTVRGENNWYLKCREEPKCRLHKMSPFVIPFVFLSVFEAGGGGKGRGLLYAKVTICEEDILPCFYNLSFFFG
jgi:hypothetical protein